MKNYNRLFLLNLIALFFLSTSSLAINSISSLKLEKGNFRILLSGHEVEPVKLAAETLSSRPLECAFTPNNQHINI